MEELDLRELFELFWRKKITIILVVIICAIVGVVYSYGFVKPRYKSSTTLVLTKTENSDTTTNTQISQSTDSITTTDITLNSKLVATYSELVKSNSVIREVISNLKIAELSESAVRGSVSVSAVKDTELIQITVSNENPVYATKIANEIAEVFTKQVADIYNIKNVHVVDKAEVAQAPYNINHKKDIAIFALVGLVLSAGYILVANMLDTTIKSSDDVEKKTGLPVLASISLYDFDGEKGGIN